MNWLQIATSLPHLRSIYFRSSAISSLTRRRYFAFLDKQVLASDLADSMVAISKATYFMKLVYIQEDQPYKQMTAALHNLTEVDSQAHLTEGQTVRTFMAVQKPLRHFAFRYITTFLITVFLWQRYFVCLIVYFLVTTWRNPLNNAKELRSIINFFHSVQLMNSIVTCAKKPFTDIINSGTCIWHQISQTAASIATHPSITFLRWITLVLVFLHPLISHYYLHQLNSSSTTSRSIWRVYRSSYSWQN